MQSEMVVGSDADRLNHAVSVTKDYLEIVSKDGRADPSDATEIRLDSNASVFLVW